MRKIVVLSALIIFGLLFAGEIRNGFYSLLLVIESTRLPEKTLMGKIFSAPIVKAVSIRSGKKKLQADLYTPCSGGDHQGLLLVHGWNPGGNREERFVMFARDLARAGFVVLAPDFNNLKSFRVRMSDAEEIVQSFLYLTNLKNTKPGGVMIGFNYGVAPMIFAAADGRMSDRVREIVSFGGYGDFRSEFLFLVTGFYEYDGTQGYLRPDSSARWMFLYKNLDLITTISDREALRMLIEKRMQFRVGEEKEIAGRLGAEGKALYSFLVNGDHMNDIVLYEKLPVSFREYLVQLSPLRVIKQVKADWIIIHSKQDYSIPYSESLRLANAIGDGKRVQTAILPYSVYAQPAPPEMGTVGAFVSNLRLFSAFYKLMKRSE